MKKILFGIFAAALILNSIPAFANKQQNYDDAFDKVIIGFDELEDDIANQEVEVGTEFSKINFPKKITALICESGYKVASPSNADDYSSANSFKKTRINVDWELDQSFSDYDEYNPDKTGVYVFSAMVDNDKYVIDAEIPQIEVEVMPQIEMLNVSNSSIKGWLYDEAASTVIIDSDDGLEDFKTNWNFETKIDHLYINKEVSEIIGFGNIKAKNLYIDCPYIPYMAFQDNDYIEYLEIGEHVEDIDGYAFAKCSNLKRVDSNSYEKNLKTVNAYAFAFCDSLEYARLPVSWLGGAVFQGCSKLEEVWIGLGNVVQERYATIDMFSGCSSLKKVWIGTNLQNIDTSMFEGCSSLEELWLLNKEAPVISEGTFDDVNHNFAIYTYTNSVKLMQDALSAMGYNFDVKVGVVVCAFHDRESEYGQWNWEYNENEHWKKCIYCGTEILKENHLGGVATSNERAVCEICGQPYGGVLAECEHENVSEWKYDEIYHWKECLDCGNILDKSEHRGGHATNTEQAVCEICGISYGETLPDGDIDDEKPDDSGSEQDPSVDVSDKEDSDVDKDNSDSQSSTDGNTTRSNFSSGSDKADNRYTAGISGNWQQSSDGSGKIIWRFILSDKTMLYDRWAEINNPYASKEQPEQGWFYFDNNGIMQTGWNLIGSDWYYLHNVSDGMLGTMQTGWIYDNDLDSWFYLMSDTGKMATGWNLINNKWYYFETESNGHRGELYVDRITPDGYKVDADGVWVVK